MRSFLAAILVMVILCVLCSTIYGGEVPPPDNSISLVGLASDDMVSGRLLWGDGGRVQLGGDVTWMDGIAAEEVEGWRFAFVGTYALIDEAPLVLPLVGELPATWYIGGLGGALVPTEGEAEGHWDATAALLTGFILGTDRAWIGAEYQYALTDDLWSELADIPDESRLLFTMGLRF